MRLRRGSNSSLTRKLLIKGQTRKPLTTEPHHLSNLHLIHISATCVRDIVFMIEDSRNSSGDQDVKLFLANIISRLEIGGDDNRVAVALFDSSVNTNIHLDDYNVTELLDRVSNIRFRHRSDHVDYNDVLKKLADYLNLHKNGDREQVADVVVIVSDHAADDRGHHHNNHDLSIVGTEVIVVNVGPNAEQVNTFGNLTTSPVLNISDYGQLTTIETDVLRMLCL